MLPAEIGFWWCCLNPREQGVLRGTIEGLMLTAFVGIPRSIWDGFWLLYEGNGEAVRVAFRSIYRLEIVTIEMGDPPVPVEVVTSDEVIGYTLWAGFLLTSEAACSGGCQQSTVP